MAQREDEMFAALLECAQNCHAVKRRHWAEMRAVLERAIVEQAKAPRARPMAIHSPGEPF